jgi:pSer/pThr/pTyr-binding forkhead associated (FHA) protein
MLKKQKKKNSSSRRSSRGEGARKGTGTTTTAEAVACVSCGAKSPDGYRFCLNCGSVLDPMEKGHKSKPPPEQATTPGNGSGAARADLGSDAVACSRCGGMCKPNEAFCAFCGAPMRTRDEADKDAEKPTRRTTKRRSRRSLSPDTKREEAPLELTQRIATPAGPQEAIEPPTRRTDRPPPLQDEVPAREVSGRLVVIIEDGSEGSSYDLAGTQIDVGSGYGDIVLPDDRYLSPRHARFFRQDGRWFLRDLDSTNGVYRRLREPAPLGDGDLVLLGLEVLGFQLVAHAEQGLGHAIENGTLVFGSPATLRRARLCQRTVEGVVRDVYHLVADETTIGREIGDIVFTSDPFMSRRHASIRWQDSAQQFVLTDLGSSNGTYLAIRDDVQLVDGDFIRLGQHLFRVDLTGVFGGAQ